MNTNQQILLPAGEQPYNSKAPNQAIYIFNSLKKAYGETIAKKLRDNVPSLFYSVDMPYLTFIKELVPVSAHLPYFLQEMPDQLNKLVLAKIVQYKEQTDINIEDTSFLKTPNELLEAVGYTLHFTPTLDEGLEFAKYYDPENLICTLKSQQADRFRKYHIFFITKPNFENEVMPAQAYIFNKYKEKSGALSSEWAQFLNANPNHNFKKTILDPYSLSLLCVQIHKTNGDIKIISRYNHALSAGSNPDQVHGGNLDGIAKGLKAAFEKELKVKIGVGAADDNFRCPKNTIATGAGGYLKYNHEANGVYVGDGFMYENGELTIINPNEARVMDQYIVYNDGKIVNPTKTLAFPIPDIKKIEFKANGVIKFITNKYGSVSIPIIGGVSQQNTSISRAMCVYGLKTVLGAKLTLIKKYDMYILDTRDVLHYPVSCVNNNIHLFYSKWIKVLKLGETQNTPQTRITNFYNLESIFGDIKFNDTPKINFPKLKTVFGGISFNNCVIWGLTMLEKTNIFIAKNSTLKNKLLSFTDTDTLEINSSKGLYLAAVENIKCLLNIENTQLISGGLKSLRTLNGSVSLINTNVYGLGEVNRLHNRIFLKDLKKFSFKNINVIEFNKDLCDNHRFVEIADMNNIDFGDLTKIVNGGIILTSSNIKTLGKLYDADSIILQNSSKIGNIGDLQYLYDLVICHKSIIPQFEHLREMGIQTAQISRGNVNIGKISHIRELSFPNYIKYQTNF